MLFFPLWTQKSSQVKSWNSLIFFICSDFNLFLFFIDILDSAFQRCPICGLTGAGFTCLEAIFELDPEALEMICLNILHYGLRIFDLLLKIGYHQHFQVNLLKIEYISNTFNYACIFQHTTKLERFVPLYDETKEKIQNEFWSKKRLRIDQVNRDGVGNTNDGNVSLTSCFIFYSDPLYIGNCNK